MRYRIDSTWYRHTHANGDTVAAGNPLRIFRFTPSAGRTLDALEAESEIYATTASLQSRLVSSGAIHPIPEGYAGLTSRIDSLTFVIPARVSDPASVRRLVDALPPGSDITVIDDGSPEPIADIGRARIVRNDVSLGPAGARNRALDIVNSEFIMFLDHDISLPVGAAEREFWLPLMFHMRDSNTAVVAPRVRSRPGSTALERYEIDRSPLDMGGEPALVRHGSRLSYVPTAALLVRTSALRSLRGFDTELRFGEDVDFVWRANDAGFVCRYEPIVEVWHDPRPSWSEFLEQRFRYGTAAAALEKRHPGETKPLRLDRWSAVVTALALLGHPFAAGAVAVRNVARLAKRLTSIPDCWQLSVHLVGRGLVSALRSTLRAAVRTWWPVTIIVCAMSKRMRRVVAGFIVIDSLRVDSLRVDSFRLGALRADHGLDPIRRSLIRLVDDAAYGSGVWFGAIRERSAACLAPRLD